jgi:hypothetical protein
VISLRLSPVQFTPEDIAANNFRLVGAMQSRKKAAALLV